VLEGARRRRVYFPLGEGQGNDRADCMARFKVAWDRLASDPARLTEFLEMKRRAAAKGGIRPTNLSAAET
jgi:hypothetical protein